MILFLHNKTPKGDPVGPVDLIVAKNRDGEEAIIDLVFHRPTSTFVPMAMAGQIAASEIPPEPYRHPDLNRDEPDYDSFDARPF